MNKMRERKQFYKSVLYLLIPMALQNLINVAVQSADVIMLGRLKESEVILSASSLAGQVCFILNLIFFGLTSGVSVLVAQYWGKKDITSIEIIWGIAMRFAIVIGLIFTMLTLAFPKQIMALFSSDAGVICEGTKYLRIVCISYLFIAFTMIYLNVMKSMEKVVISTLVYLISLVINIICNYIFIYGKLGCPALGIEGAAIGTVIARISEFVITLVYNRYYNKVVQFHFRFLCVRDKILSGDFIKFSMPVVVNELMWGLGMAVNSAIIGNLGSAASSANAIVQVVRQLSMVIGLGIATATAVMIGKVIGEGKMKLAREYGKRFMQLAVFAGILGSLVVLVVRPFILHTMNLGPTAKGYLGFMMYIMAYYVIFQSISTTGIVGVFRAGGDTKFGLYIDVSCLWFVSILFGIFAAFVWKLDVKYVYIILMLDEVVKQPFVFWRYKTYRWLKNITRNQTNLEGK